MRKKGEMNSKERRKIDAKERRNGCERMEKLMQKKEEINAKERRNE